MRARQRIEDRIGRIDAELDLGLEPSSIERVGGGSINRTLRCASRAGPVLLKLNAPDRREMLQTEALGLAALAAAQALDVPRVVAAGATDEDAYLVLEWIDFGAATPGAEMRLGRGLAQLHRCTSERFGWQKDNTIGSTPQANAWVGDWCSFWRERRLVPQLELAARNGLPRECLSLAARLVEGLETLLGDHAPVPSLLHGDLWGGNWGAALDGRPYVFDPAVYYGDRETDLAMTRLFGGFGPAFYRAYEDAWALPPDAANRGELYALYHLLNHFNLFGVSYRASVARSLAALAGRL